MPFVRLSGAWLAPLGFRCGTEVAVTSVPGRIALELAPPAQHPRPDPDPYAWELAPLRETALLYVGRLEDVAMLRRAGRTFYCHLLDPLRSPGMPGPTVPAELEAVARDLRYLEGFMAKTVGGEPTGAESIREAGLAACARLWAVAAGRIATEIEEAVGSVDVCRWAAVAVDTEWWRGR